MWHAHARSGSVMIVACGGLQLTVNSNIGMVLPKCPLPRPRQTPHVQHDLRSSRIVLWSFSTGLGHRAFPAKLQSMPSWALGRCGGGELPSPYNQRPIPSPNIRPYVLLSPANPLNPHHSDRSLADPISHIPSAFASPAPNPSGSSLIQRPTAAS